MFLLYSNASHKPNKARKLSHELPNFIFPSRRHHNCLCAIFNIVFGYWKVRNVYMARLNVERGRKNLVEISKSKWDMISQTFFSIGPKEFSVLSASAARSPEVGAENAISRINIRLFCTLKTHKLDTSPNLLRFYFLESIFVRFTLKILRN